VEDDSHGQFSDQILLGCVNLVPGFMIAPDAILALGKAVWPSLHLCPKIGL